MTWRVECGDCRELLATLADNSVDSVVCDPPYELGFMGKGWDRSGIAYDSRMWAEVLRVLKPGGHLLAFGGTRTSHAMVMAIEDAGFEIRDSIHWTYGSGFPKSLNVSKAIDAADGVTADRAVVHKYTAGGNAGTSTADKGGTYVVGAPNSAPIELAVTRGATERSQAWDGWGTALKPGHEPIVMARKPLAGTVAGNVLEHGTGALNIDGCRVGDGSDKTPAPTARGESRPSFTTADPENLGGDDSRGRWPANVVFTHSAGCRRVGERRVRSQAPPMEPVEPARNAVYGKFARFEDNANNRHADADGTECVPTYDCADDCPVRALESQSGESGQGRSDDWTKPRGGSGGIFRAGTAAPCAPLYDGRGTAARFFNCFEWSPEHDDPAAWPPFQYVAKAATAEREAGCEALPKRGAAELTSSKEGQARLNSPRTGAGRTSEGRANTHPTVKPIELMRWLVRLVTPPGGAVLDPFTGSGTTGCAAVLEGLRFVGLELDPHHVAIARARITYWEPKQLQLFGEVGT